ncbi:MAG: porin family protein [Pseudomonadota bacterium]
MQTQFLFFALGATLFCAQAGSAQETDSTKFSADIGYSRVGRDLPVIGSVEPEPEYGGIGGHVGYSFSQHWSVEGEAIIGVENDKDVFRSFSDTASSVANVKTELNHLLGVYVKGTLPITSKLNASARLGLAHAEIGYSGHTVVTDLETQETTTFTFENSGDQSGTAIGIGLSYDVTDKIYVRGDFTQYDLTDDEMESASVGIGFRF